MEQQPPPINYRTPLGPSGEPPGPSFSFGMAVGSMVSLILWPTAFHFSSDAHSYLLEVVIIIIAAKFVLAIAATVSSKWRRFGAGLFASFGIGFLIFFGTCFVALTKA